VVDRNSGRAVANESRPKLTFSAINPYIEWTASGALRAPAAAAHVELSAA
jgi:hypothetical protein